MKAGSRVRCKKGEALGEDVAIPDFAIGVVTGNDGRRVLVFWDRPDVVPPCTLIHYGYELEEVSDE
jgi:hypothetical protein